MKTAKEKAEELVGKFRSTGISFNAAKQCALICVDEIIKETKLHDKTTFQHGRTAYWNEVKTEIQKL